MRTSHQASRSRSGSAELFRTRLVLGLGIAGALVAAFVVILLVGTPHGSVSDRDEVFFESGFETGDGSEWAQVWQVADGRRFTVGQDDPPPAEGRFRARFEVRPGERERWTGDARTEVSQHKAAYLLRPGMELYFRFRVYLPRGFPIQQSGWGQLVWQLHQRGTSGSPPQALVILGDGKWALVGNESRDGSLTTFWRGPRVELERWHDFIVQIRFSRDDRDGWIGLWRDGVPQAMANGRVRMRARTLIDEYSSMRFGLYRADEYDKTAVMYGDGYVVGRTLAAVDGS